MTNIGIELLVLTLVLLNVGAILTANIYSRSLEEFKQNILFCTKSFSNPYFIIWKNNFLSHKRGDFWLVKCFWRVFK